MLYFAVFVSTLLWLSRVVSTRKLSVQVTQIGCFWILIDYLTRTKSYTVATSVIDICTGPMLLPFFHGCQFKSTVIQYQADHK